MRLIKPEKIAPAKTFDRRGVSPNLSEREINVINALAQCRAALLDSLARFWPSPSKGKKKILSLLRWGVLWSYTLGEAEIVTLSPLSERIAGVPAYVPDGPREAAKVVLASEVFLRALANVPCSFEAAPYPLQGILTVGDRSAGVLVLFRDENPALFKISTRCFVVCEDEEHILNTAKSITFPALYATQEALFEKDVSEAFFCCENGVLHPEKLGLLAAG